MNVFKMAWRNVWRNKRRSGVTIAAMTLALWVLVLYSGLITGFLRGMESDIVDLEIGDVQIHAEGYLDRPSLYERIGDVDALLAKLDAAGYPASPRLMGGGLAAAGENAAGVSFRGVDAARDAAVSGIAEHLSAGKWIDPADPDGVVVGRRLARTLGVGVGDEVVVLGQAADGSLANELYRVRGILATISDGTDRTAFYMPSGTFRELLAVPSGVHQIVVRRPQAVPVAQAAEAVRAAAPKLDVKSWRELMPTVAQMLDSAQGMMMFVFFIVYIAVGILVLNAMLMAVFERIREFGVLKAIGVGPGRVLSLILVESLIQMAVATVVGLALAVPAMWFMTEHGLDMSSLGGTSAMGVAIRPIWYGVYDVSSVTGPVTALLVIGTLAVLYPALKAARVRPVVAMRHR